MKQLSNSIQRLSQILDKVSGIIIVGIMLLVSANVIIKNVLKINFITETFNLVNPIKGTSEIVGIFTAVAVALALAYCAFQKGHIAVGFILDYFPQKVQFVIDGLNNIVAIGFWGITFVYFLKYANRKMISGQITATGEIPIYPFIYVVAFGFFVFTLTLIFSLREDIVGIKKDSKVKIKIGEKISEEVI